MMNKYVRGLAVFVFIAAFLILSGCKSGAVPKPPVAKVEVEKPQINKYARKKRAPKVQTAAPEKPAIGLQQGGARQGTNLGLKNIVSTFAGRTGVAGSADGNATRARFDAPKGISTDGNYLYVTDLNNHTIRKIEIANGKVTTIAGLAGKKGSDDGKGSSARFNRPYGIVADDGLLYVSDSNNHSVRQIDLDSGDVTTIAGGVGLVGYVDGPGKDARFFIPEGITTDGDNLYVADTHNHSIRKIDLETNIVTTLAGLSGSPGYIDDIGAKARFAYPKGITTDGHNLYVVDFGNHRVRKIVIATGVVTTLADGANVADSSSSEKSKEVHFNYPTGITTDGRYLYVVDTFNRTVRKISLANATVTTIAGKADLEGANNGVGETARFRDPVGITTDGISLYVTDSNNQTVRKIR